MKSFVLFLVTFLVGAALALGARTALHKPYAEPAPASSVPTASTEHSGHAKATSTPADAKSVVNTVCAICGMEVDPEVKPATYQGKLVGFGCAACPPKFAKDPDRYGPHALRNEVAPKK